MASTSSLSLEDLCEELLRKIFACVACSSIQDIHRNRLVSRKFYSLSYDKDVLARASLDISMLSWYQYPWNSSPRWVYFPDDVDLEYVQKYDDFVNMCLQQDNPQAPMAIFNLGLRQYFEATVAERHQQNRGLMNLACATTRGIREAAEFYGVILICLGGEHKRTGFNILHPLRIHLNQSEVMQIQARWESHARLLWLSLRPDFIVYELKGRYVRENCHCDGLTSRWFEVPWEGLERFQQFAGMPSVEACEACLWHAIISRLFGIAAQ